jgi:hypothetical protein
LKEICHSGLAMLIGEHGTFPVESWVLDTLISSSIEPDQINKQQMAKNLMNTLTISLEWLIDHTIRAKELAIRCVQMAIRAKRNGSNLWPRYLGWAFHYIADWGTPHHSPISKSNPVLASTGTGAVIGGVIGGISKSEEKLGAKLKRILKGALIGAGVGGGIGVLNLVIHHNEFENRCDQRWESAVALIKDSFIIVKRLQLHPSQSQKALHTFQSMMVDLRESCNNLPADWINTSSDIEFADYMVKIALIMDFACQIVVSG